MGRPIVTTDVPGCRDVVEHGINGILCAARDAASLADVPTGPAIVPLALWQAHVARAAAHIGRLRVGWPRPGLAHLDPRALRCALLLAVIAACFAVSLVTERKRDTARTMLEAIAGSFRGQARSRKVSN